MRKRLLTGAVLALAACATGSSNAARITPLRAPATPFAETVLALAAICGGETHPLGQHGDLQRVSGMGTGGFKVDTDNFEAQAWFDYGLALSHAFYHEDAKTAMRRAVAADPDCALCQWGLGWALGPTLNYQISEQQRSEALAAADKAHALLKPGEAKAARLVAAIQARYQVQPGANLKPGELTPNATEPAFGQAMLKIAQDYPDDAEIAVLASHALLIPVRQNNKSGVEPALGLLEGVLKKQPNNTGAIHFFIHATEFAGRAEDALPYADKLGKLAPAASHLVHMPAHTYFHAGRYEEAALVNARAIDTDRTWLFEGGALQASAPMYYGHNLAFGLFGALMAGDGKLALKYADDAAQVWPGDAALSSNAVPRTFVALALYAPDRALALPEPAKPSRNYSVYRHYARGEAFLIKGDVPAAKIEAKAILATPEAAQWTDAQVAEGVLSARIAMAEGRLRIAEGDYERAAKLQETSLSDVYDPPPWWYPIRRSVAAVYLKAGDNARAEAEAQKSLAYWKHDPLALWVLAKAQLAQGHLGAGEASIAEAQDLWRGDFESITAEQI